jgi:hypothetical protein
MAFGGKARRRYQATSQTVQAAPPQNEQERGVTLDPFTGWR